MTQEAPIQLDLSVETLALLGRNQPEGPIGTILPSDESTRPRCCGGGSQNTPPTCCP
jgi:hypothetical protein